MEYIAFFAVAFIIVLFIFIYGKIEEHKSKIWLYKKRKELFGNYPNKNYPDNRFSTLMQSVEYRKQHSSQTDDLFVIDDITWNDLDMDRIFQSMDYAVSSVGEDALYRWLRIPELSDSQLVKREKHYDYLQNHKDECVKYQMIMSKVGKTGKYTIYQYFDFLDVLENSRCISDWVIDFVIVATLLLGIFVNTMCIYVSIAFMIYHGFQYFTKKAKIEPYFESVAYFVRILKATDSLHALPASFHEEFQDELNLIKECKKIFQSFMRGSALALDQGATTGAGDIGQLIMTYFKMIFHFDMMKFYSMIHIVKDKREHIIELMEIMGEIEACISVVYYRNAISTYCIPTFENKDTRPQYEAKQIFHPLIPDAVKNDVHQNNCMLLTGSNASGKSTFLKTVACNALLAQSIHTVCADEYNGSFFRIYSSMALRDSIKEGDSYFIVEIKSMKRIFDAAKTSTIPILCTIDEVLRGTNTAERIGASTELLKALSKERVLCFAATHDRELTVYLQEIYDNYHFEETIVDKTISFPYILTKGPSKGRNAIKLLEAFGFDEEITKKANALAGELACE